jgi:hypothetical protein
MFPQDQLARVTQQIVGTRLLRDQTSSVHHVHVYLFQSVNNNFSLRSCYELTYNEGVQAVLSQTECSEKPNWSGSNNENICVTRF